VKKSVLQCLKDTMQRIGVLVVVLVSAVLASENVREHLGFTAEDQLDQIRMRLMSELANTCSVTSGTPPVTLTLSNLVGPPDYETSDTQYSYKMSVCETAVDTNCKKPIMVVSVNTMVKRESMVTC